MASKDIPLVRHTKLWGVYCQEYCDRTPPKAGRRAIPEDRWETKANRSPLPLLLRRSC
jgi:hypothetical protein